MLGWKRATDPVKTPEGPSIQESEPLLEWLNSNARSASGQPRLFRLPVVISFEDKFRLELGNAFIGVSEERLGENAIELSLDTAAMGISLWSLLNERCPKASISCAVWLDGYWGSAIELDQPQTRKAGEKWPFAVVRLHGLIDARTQRSKTIQVLLLEDDH